jgi:sensor c-di-GMP phosphodiesterase-like protein
MRLVSHTSHCIAAQGNDRSNRTAARATGSARTHTHARKRNQLEYEQQKIQEKMPKTNSVLQCSTHGTTQELAIADAHRG